LETGDDLVSAARMPGRAVALVGAGARLAARSSPTEKAEVVVVVVGKHHCSLEVQLLADPTVRLLAVANQGQLITFAQAEPPRSSLHELERLLENTVHS
jgi:hypothetical protein